MDDVIQLHFYYGWNYAEIQGLLSARYNRNISIRHLKRILKRLDLCRRKRYTYIFELAEFIEAEIQGSGRQHGYRWMHLKCIQNGLRTSRETVRLLLLLLDPIGVANRRRGKLVRRSYYSKGPNYIWHLDGYDKLKPYGFCISGCIDGYSRNIMWLNVFTTNNNPRVIAGYFLDTVDSVGGCPRRIRSDLGTENGYVKEMQTFLQPNDNEFSFITGTSKLNQRIESWWGMFRKECGQFWMDTFQKLSNDGLYDGGFIDKNLLQFCLMDIIQGELDEVANVWNNHIIRPSRNARVPSGRPQVMYTVPEMYDVDNYLQEVDQAEFNACIPECIFIDDQAPCDSDIAEICHILVEENNLNMEDSDPYQRINVYESLRQLLLNEL